MRTFRTLTLLAALFLPSMTTMVEAATFSDVTSTSLYAPAISALADKGIIKGNPDGTFAPDNTVNRAEFLTMLYRVMKETPSAPSQPCFKDAPAGSWFEAVVCDAAAQGHVSGYADKTFKPELPVNRVEALKMIFTVLGLSMQSTLEATARATAYTDVSSTAWYMPYLSASMKLRILPVPGANAKTFGPDQLLTRAEAAAYIYNAISSQPLPLDGSWPSSSSASSSSMMQTSSVSSTDNSQTSSVSTVTIRDFPFSDNGTFQKKLPVSYKFTLSQTTVASITATVADNNTQGDVTCRLFKLDGGTSFSLEYYLGYQGPDVCNMRVALAPGSYQLDVAPTVAGLSYTVFTKATTGDSNDGFSQAKMVQMNKPYTGLMDASDYGDFYKFSLSQQTTMTINLSNADHVRCVVYPMEDVDIFGFSGPNCNQSYQFPSGTYYIGIMQKDGNWDKPSYTIQLSQ